MEINKIANLLNLDHVKFLISIFKENNIEIRLVGGCIRDALLEREIKDIDTATTLKPQDILSLLIALLAYYWSNSLAPNSPVWLKIIVGLFGGYVSLLILNNVVPNLNRQGHRVSNYVVGKAFGTVDGMSYIYIFPPLFAVLIIFLILLYTGQLG